MESSIFSESARPKTRGAYGAYPLSVPSCTTRVIEAGTGKKAVLLLHGVGARADRWSRNILQLSDAGFHVYAIDFPGHGFAAKGQELAYSVPAFGLFVQEVMTALKIEQPAIVGTSLGAHVAAALAAGDPSSVCALILVGPMGLIPMGLDARRALAEAIVDTSRAAVSRKLKRLVHAEGLVTEAWIDEEWRTNNSRGAAEAMAKLAAYFTGGLDGDTVGGELAIQAPDMQCLLVWGSHDVMVPTACAPQVLSALPANTKLEIIGESAHAPYLERSPEFNRLAIEFLNKVHSWQSLEAPPHERTS